MKPVEPKPDFVQLENDILAWWNENHIPEKAVTSRAGSPRFTLYEGPPTANAAPGIHHVLARIFKDVMPRYKTMKGFYAPRKAGWDTHGLPVELQVEKAIGAKTKKDIEAYGIDAFNQKCRELVWSFKENWERVTARIGYWLDMEHPYITYEPRYIESVWWILKKIWDKNLLYEDYKVVPYCPRCGTPLSSHEVALGYKDTTDPSVYVRFKKGDGEYFLVWTTTPWTLPANAALAVHPELEYVKVEITSHDAKEPARRYILAKDRLPVLGADPKNVTVLETYKGKELVGLPYEALYDARETEQFKAAKAEKIYSVIAGAFVSTEEGTGIVHIAPAYGEEDLTVGRAAGLPVLHFVDEEGMLQFGPERALGMFVKKADAEIIADLTARGLIEAAGEETHSYPFCWRCETPLLYYAGSTWFIKMTALKDSLLANNEKINWIPAHIKHGRFGNFLDSVQDWALSRKRYWGTPLPLWVCESCKKTECIGSFAALKERAASGYTDGMDPHRPHIDAVTFSCAACKGTMRRVPDVIDVWFDSGAMPAAQWHYPFEGKEEFAAQFPADYISEGVDQTRGWFYTLLAIATLLELGPPYKNVISFGLVLDEKGQKMSKSKGNVVDPEALLKETGADALRLYMLSATSPGNFRRFSKALVLELQSRFILTFWNVYGFFVTYALTEGLTPDELNKTRVQITDRPVLDRWILARLNEVVERVTKELDSYDPTGAARTLIAFLDDLSNWYLRRSRKRFSKNDDTADKRAAYHTLYKVLVGYARLLAPFIPFITETIYQNLRRSDDPESVHLTAFPAPRHEYKDDALLHAMGELRAVVELGLGARREAGVKVRQPLQELRIAGLEEPFAPELEAVLLDELNIKVVRYLPQIEEASDTVSQTKGRLMVQLDLRLTPELKEEGLVRDVIRSIQELRKTSGLGVMDRAAVTVAASDRAIHAAVTNHSSYIARETSADSVSVVKHLPEGDAQVKKLKLGGKDAAIALRTL